MATTISQTLQNKIIEAVKRSEAAHGVQKYQAQFSTGKSGLALGEMQNDVGNQKGQAEIIFTDILQHYGEEHEIDETIINKIITTAKPPLTDLARRRRHVPRFL